MGQFFKSFGDTVCGVGSFWTGCADMNLLVGLVAAGVAGILIVVSGMWLINSLGNKN